MNPYLVVLAVLWWLNRKPSSESKISGVGLPWLEGEKFPFAPIPTPDMWSALKKQNERIRWGGQPPAGRGGV